ncbi:MAG TPA: GT4 family glycosyltransferase PelF [Thermoanaerobaculia bacterium]|nr:GT4 family glycosyltransferase PelF [Thermoanaerobaculia bacterium]
MSLSVLMTTEGTYPYSAGGVSTWCDALLRNTPEVRYMLLPIMMSPHIELKYDPPDNVRRIITVPLWGIEEPAEFLTDIPFAQLYDRKRRTTSDAIEREFIPRFRDFLEVASGASRDYARFGRTLVALEDFFRAHDYNQTFKHPATWRTFKYEMEVRAAEGVEPTLFDLTECLRWLYRFLIVLNVRVPRTSVTHATAAAFCGLPCITAKVRDGTPMIVTEHGVYLREQYLFLSRFRRLFFCKQFLMNLFTAVVHANYHFADVIAPVCHYNTRWEIAHGTPRQKIQVIYNGVEPDHFAAAPKLNGVQHVVTTARIDPLKDIETLLRVAARVRETHRDVRFTVYGAVADEAYYRRCLTLRTRLKLDDVVQLGSATNDVVAAYREADVVLLTSISEAFPYSVLEAMSCEKAVVASDVGGVSEALEGCGVLVKPRDDEAFANEIRTLLDNRALRLRLGTKARARVLEEFTLDGSIARYLALYLSLAAGRSPLAEEHHEHYGTRPTDDGQRAHP